MSFEPLEHEEGMDPEGPQGKRSHESKHVGCVQNQARQERPTISAARGKAQPDYGQHPRAHHAVPGEGMSLQQRPVLNGQQVESTAQYNPRDPSSHGALRE